ncbi:MAG: hypothetical protein ABFS35_04855 [Bacteroidota bacterium]
MKKVFKYRKKLRLKQGQFYHFKLHKLSLSPEGMNYFVLVDPYGDKHLVPVEYYSSYNLKVGSSYLCKVDKINCAGQIFIEPPHPFYRENRSYLFRFMHRVEVKHKSGIVEPFYQFEGENSYYALLSAENFIFPKHLESGIHTFLVKKISKGMVYIDY